MAGANVFAYGTLIFPEVLAAVAGRAHAAEPASLAGFARICVRGAVYPAAIEDATGTVAGVLYRGVDPLGVERLDRFEGGLYDRVRVTVSLGDGGRTEAFAYVVPASRFDRLERRPWEPEAFRRRHLAAYLARCRAGDVADEYQP